MNQVRVGVAALILDGNKILLGHRCVKKEDTGGIIGRDTWCLPGGKQEFDETILECAIRETKEECNLDLHNPEVYAAIDDFAVDRHFVTISTITTEFSGELKVMEPDKQDEWKWFDLDELPSNLYGPSENSIKYFKDNILKKENNN